MTVHYEVISLHWILTLCYILKLISSTDQMPVAGYVLVTIVILTLNSAN